jgi:hypothetical protein
MAVIDPLGVLRQCEDAFFDAPEGSDEAEHAAALWLVAAVATHELVDPTWSTVPFMNAEFRGPSGRVKLNALRVAASQLVMRDKDVLPSTPEEMLSAVVEGRFVRR